MPPRSRRTPTKGAQGGAPALSTYTGGARYKRKRGEGQRHSRDQQDNGTNGDGDEGKQHIDDIKEEEEGNEGGERGETATEGRSATVMTTTTAKRTP